MDIKAFDYDLPSNLIALHPTKPRSASRLLVYRNKQICDSLFNKLSHFLNSNDLLVFNDTKVLPAKLSGKRIRKRNSVSYSSKIEVSLNKKLAKNCWSTFCRPTKRLVENDIIYISTNLTATVSKIDKKNVELIFSLSDDDLMREFFRIGTTPLPSYISKARAITEDDLINYQSVFAKNVGAVAAPTASLHFDEKIFADLNAKNISYCFVTLHVGGGTFLPITVENIHDHKMHSEYGKIDSTVAALINKKREQGGRIIPVGTTALKLLESAADSSGKVKEFIGDTNLFIKPSYKFLVSDGLITNFHLPKSTLLMLVSALVGSDRVNEIYSHAISEEYRFFSYGDGSLLLP